MVSLKQGCKVYSFAELKTAILNSFWGGASLLIWYGVREGEVCYLSRRYVMFIRLNAFLFAMLVNSQMLVWLPLRSSHLPPLSLAKSGWNHNQNKLSTLDFLPVYPGPGSGLTWSIVLVELLYLGGEIFFKLRLKELCRISKQIEEH